MQRHTLQIKFMISFLLVLTVEVCSIEDGEELKDINIDNTLNHHTTFNHADKKDESSTVTSDELSSLEYTECTSPLQNVNGDSLHSKKPCKGVDSSVPDGDDLSEPTLLGEDNDKQPFATKIGTASQDYCPKLEEEVTYHCRHHSAHIADAVQDDHPKVEQDDVNCKLLEKNSKYFYKIQNEKNEGDGHLEKERRSEILVDDNAGRELEQEEMDPELENVPLREILLKLKPEGLTDDEDEHLSDYSLTEANMEEDTEVEEEVLMSSGSAEKQEEVPDDNSSGSSNSSSGSSNSNSNSGGSKKAVCLQLNVTEPITDVEIINATTLMRLLQVDPNVTSRSSAGPCYLIYFFSPYCPFSVMGSAYVNALSRSVPNIPVYGLDSIEHHSVNARYGVMGTPTLLLFHNGNGVGRYNASEYSVAQLLSFIRHYTDQEIVNINVTSSDFRATLPAQVAEGRPYALWAAWTFLISFASWLFLTSEICARLTEAILNNWREAEAQNDHQD
ncbi:thioredoxin domain-containing protein 15 [Cherax quadricarinatus]|nr:thioredoxin domain-containing protein 15-like [Cherax quadricarinatus]